MTDDREKKSSLHVDWKMAPGDMVPFPEIFFSNNLFSQGFSFLDFSSNNYRGEKVNIILIKPKQRDCQTLQELLTVPFI